jgi:hypothetical protein
MARKAVRIRDLMTATLTAEPMAAYALRAKAAPNRT